MNLLFSALLFATISPFSINAYTVTYTAGTDGTYNEASGAKGEAGTMNTKDGAELQSQHLANAVKEATHTINGVSNAHQSGRPLSIYTESIADHNINDIKRSVKKIAEYAGNISTVNVTKQAVTSDASSAKSVIIELNASDASIANVAYKVKIIIVTNDDGDEPRFVSVSFYVPGKASSVTIPKANKEAVEAIRRINEKENTDDNGDHVIVFGTKIGDKGGFGQLLTNQPYLETAQNLQSSSGDPVTMKAVGLTKLATRAVEAGQ